MDLSWRIHCWLDRRSGQIPFVSSACVYSESSQVAHYLRLIMSGANLITPARPLNMVWNPQVLPVYTENRGGRLKLSVIQKHMIW